MKSFEKWLWARGDEDVVRSKLIWQATAGDLLESAGDRHGGHDRVFSSFQQVASCRASASPPAAAREELRERYMDFNAGPMGGCLAAVWALTQSGVELSALLPSE
jgi:hypothetical protein